MSRVLAITSFPRHSLKGLLLQVGPMSQILQCFDELFAFGRDALYWGFKALGNSGGLVWFPAYHCGVEVQAAIDAGYEVDFYRVSTDLTIDESDLEARLSKRPGVVMIIHYLGFPQPGRERIAAVCNRLRVPLVEDCSHALLTRCADGPIGRLGDFAIFSLYKSLCTCDGGALLVNPRARQKLNGCIPEGRASLYGYRLQFNALVKGLLGAKLSRSIRDRRKGAEQTQTPTTPAVHDYGRRMSGLSRRLARTMDPALIMRRRRDNWSTLDRELSGFRGYQKVFAGLPEGVCPLFFPIWVSNRPALVRKLEAQDVEPFVFAAHPHPRLNLSEFPESKRLRDEILCLPIHQYLSEAEIKHLASVLGPALGEHKSAWESGNPGFERSVRVEAVH